MTRQEMSRVVDSLSDLAAGAGIQEARQREEGLISLKLRAAGRTLWLTISCQHGLACLFLSEDKPKSPKGSEGPKGPSRFQGAMRRHLVGKILLKIEIAEADRIVTLHVARDQERGSLVCELFNRGGNLILLDSEGRVIDAVRRRKGVRELGSGSLYAPPPPPPLPHDETPPRDFGSGIEADAAFAAGSYFEREFEEAEEDALLRKLSRALSRESKRTRKYLGRLEDELAGLEDPRALQNLGDHFAAHIREHRRGAKSMEVPDFHGPGTITIPLNPSLGPSGNLEALYSRARRNRRKKTALAGRIEEIRRQGERLREWERRMEEAAGMEGLRALEEEMKSRGLVPRDANKKAGPRRETKKGPRRHLARDGAEIYVGRGAEENDRLSFRFARGNDWWFHVLGGPGAHVIVRLPRGRELSQETLLDAATLAILGSRLSRQGGGEVTYTQKKYLRKPKGGPPGRVIAENTKTINIRIEETRVKRLYEAHGE